MVYYSKDAVNNPVQYGKIILRPQYAFPNGNHREDRRFFADFQPFEPELISVFGSHPGQTMIYCLVLFGPRTQ